MLDHNTILDADKMIDEFYVSGSSPFALGHYPSDAIFPGVMSLYLMRDLADAFYGKQFEQEIKEVTLRRITYVDTIRPGDVLKIGVYIKKITERAVQINAAVVVDDLEKSTSSFIYER